MQKKSARESDNCYFYVFLRIFKYFRRVLCWMVKICNNREMIKVVGDNDDELPSNFTC